MDKVDTEEGSTILFVNAGPDIYKVRYRGRKIATLYQGERECVNFSRTAIPVAENIRLAFEVNGSVYRSPGFRPYSRKGWDVTIGTTPHLDVLSLQPSPQCKTG